MNFIAQIHEKAPLPGFNSIWQRHIYYDTNDRIQRKGNIKYKTMSFSPELIDIIIVVSVVLGMIFACINYPLCEEKLDLRGDR